MHPSMRKMNVAIPQSAFASFSGQIEDWLKKSWANSVDKAELTRFEEFQSVRKEHCPHGPATVMNEVPWWDKGVAMGKIASETRAREAAAKSLIKAMFLARMKDPDFVKAGGVTSALGYNFYDLRAPVYLLYPVNVPFRNSIPRVGRVNDGYGTAAHWKATRNVGSNYVGVSEPNRNATQTPDENDYLATYKQIGNERAVTFSAQFGGEGYADNLSDEHLRGLQSLWLGEEGMDLLGNSGVGNGGNGYQLGTPVTPTIVRNAVTTGGFSGSTSVSVSVVYLTGMGNPNNTQYGYFTAPTVAGGLITQQTRTNADGSQDVINGGCSAISAMSAVVTCDSTHQTATATAWTGTAFPKGVFGYAWFVNTTDASSPTLANAKLYAITQFPTVTITAAATGTQTGVATGLSNDNSAQVLDYDGLLTYAAVNGGWQDLGGGSLTSNKDGSVSQIETALQYIYANFQCGVDAIWGDSTAVTALDQAVKYSGTNQSGMQVFLARDEVNNIIGGFVVSGYQSRYTTGNPTGANVIPIRIHPMMPKGTLYFDISSNPYPHSRQPYVRAMLVQRDYYSIEWPVVSRQWTFGTYSHQVLAHNMPWLSYVITGIGNFVGS